jgi:hypothetical protein
LARRGEEMLWFEKKRMSSYLGRRPYVSFFLSHGEKAKVLVLSENEVIESFTSEGWDIVLTPETRFIVVHRRTRSQRVIHVFQVVERIGQPDVVEVARCSSVARFREWSSQNLGFVPSIEE